MLVFRNQRVEIDSFRSSRELSRGGRFQVLRDVPPENQRKRKHEGRRIWN